MATIKLKLRPSSVPEAEGTLYYQVIHKRRVKWISTGCQIYPYEWDHRKEALLITDDNNRRTEPESMQCNINQGLAQWSSHLHTGKDTEASLADTVAPPNRTRTHTTVFQFMQKQALKKEQMKRQGTAHNYINAYRRFKEFRKDTDLAFHELTPDLMERFEAWLIDRRLKQNSIRCYLRTLNTLLYKAVAEGFLAEHNLFSRVRLSYVKTTKRAISETALKTIAQLPLPQGSTLALARDIFMFSFYMRGMPFVDIAYLRKTDLKVGTLTYCRKKTNQCLVIEWEQAQQQIVDRYAHQTNDSPYLLPIIRADDGTEYQQYQRMHTNINRALKKIGQLIGLKMPLTTYVARHTWASIARDMNIPIAIISEGMGHNSLKTTQIYLNSIDTSKINEANKKIIRRINKKRN